MVKRGRDADSPGSMDARCNLFRTSLAHSKLGQLIHPSSPVLPLRPQVRSDSSSDPPVQLFQHIARLAETIVSSPSFQIDGKIFDHPLQTYASTAMRHFPDSFLKTLDGLRRDSPFHFSKVRHVKTES